MVRPESCGLGVGMISINHRKAFSFVSSFAVLSWLAVAGGVGKASADDAHRSHAAQVGHVDERGALVLADGGELCLTGIRVPTDDEGYDRPASWRSAWLAIVEGQTFFHQIEHPLEHDRYGCPFAHVETANRVPLQHLLLEAGWAVTDPSSVSEERGVGTGAVDTMLRLEDQARKAGRGIWRGSRAGPRTADDLSRWIGTRQLVEGRVRRMSDNDRYIYLNFGADWRTDFTVRLNRKMIDAARIDPAKFDGRKLRIRGFLQDSRGPLIDIAHPKQIEFLP